MVLCIAKGLFLSLVFFLRVYFLIVCVFVCTYKHMYVQVPVRPKDSNGPLKLKLQDVVSCLTEMPKTEVKSRYREHTSQIFQWEQRKGKLHNTVDKVDDGRIGKEKVTYLFSQTIKESYFINIAMSSSEATLYNIVQA